MRITSIFSTICLIAAPLITSNAFADGEALAPKKPFLPNRLDLPLPKQVIASGSEIAVDLEFSLPAKHHLNKEAPSRVIVTSPGTQLMVTSPISELNHKLSIPHREPGNGVLELSAMLYYCEDGNTTLCKIRGVAMTQAYETAANGAKQFSVKAAIPD